MSSKPFLLILIAAAACAAPVEFNRDIRPILSDRCYTCHGPDQSKNTSKLRLDQEASAKTKLNEIVRRVSSEDAAVRMPPAWSGAAKLGPREIDLITRWVAEGGQWEKHWSLIPPRRPFVRDGVNAIDYFVRARLDREGFKPSPEADRRTLIRRVSLDLTGLPPTLSEINGFLNDTAPNAYEKVVDRLLASPHYGERMAERWLDAARYADTNGYQTDGERSMWRWRDWVINAFNNNMRYDEFALEQTAGDLLPHATPSQIVATGFNRNHRGNGEGGIIAEEYAVEYVVDRVETNSTVWLGLTLGCTRCHNHKYDPFTQKEFYQFFAYFNNVPERGKSFKYGNSPPLIPAPTPDQQAKLEQLDQKLTQARAQLAKITQPDASWQPSDPSWEPDRALEVTFLKTESFDGKRVIDAGDKANSGFYDSVSWAAWIKPEAANGTILSRAKDESEGVGLSLCLHDGHLQTNLVQRWLDDGGRVESDETLPLNKWSHVLFTYDGSRFANGIRLYLNGRPLKTKTLLDDLNQNFASKEPLRIGGGVGLRFQGEIRDVRIYKDNLSPEEAAILAVPESVGQIARSAQRTPEQSHKLFQSFLASQPANTAVVSLEAERKKMVASFPTVMVMEESSPPRETHLLIRGAYDRPGEKVEPGVPKVLPPLPEGAPNNRLGFARWLISPDNPLPARVAVNRFWQMYFGTGIVKTVEDFGSQGEWPSHPELLDWLATEFVRTGWNIKAMQKTIVMSATYRQSSKDSPELLQKDPENRLLARGPRVRLPAEMVRDQALAISGLLVEKIGGPSVKPYQPAGLWKELAGGEDYQPDKGEGLHRRSLYTFWKRTAPPPMMMNFDSAGREACVVREVRTNTPLQSLNLMNDVTFLEASRVLAQRMMREGGETPAGRLAYGFELATARKPKPRESDVLMSSFRYYSVLFQTGPGAATKYVQVGDVPQDPALNPTELAAYATVASLILNLDETVTKQ